MSFDQLVSEFNELIKHGSSRFIKRKHTEFVKTILANNVLAEFLTIDEKIWALKNNTLIRPRCYCGAATKFHQSSLKFHTFCGTRCSRQHPETLASRNDKRLESGAVQKMQDTIIRRYGKDGIKERRANGVIKKYGVSNYFATDEFKQRNKAHNLATYGVDYYTQTDEYKQKYKQTCLATYGVDHYSKSHEFKKLAKFRYELSMAKLNEQYGVSHASQIKIADQLALITDNEWLYKQYIELDKSSNAIAEEFGISATTVLNYLRRAEIDIKSFMIGYSYKCITWLDHIMKTEDILIEHALNLGEFVIPGTRYRADGYCKETNTVYEFHGDVWHGNPTIYAPTDTPNPFSENTAHELYKKTQLKEHIIKTLGYTLVVKWEKEWDLETTTH